MARRMAIEPRRTLQCGGEILKGRPLAIVCIRREGSSNWNLFLLQRTIWVNSLLWWSCQRILNFSWIVWREIKRCHSSFICMKLNAGACRTSRLCLVSKTTQTMWRGWPAFKTSSLLMHGILRRPRNMPAIKGRMSTYKDDNDYSPPQCSARKPPDSLR